MPNGVEKVGVGPLICITCSNNVKGGILKSHFKVVDGYICSKDSCSGLYFVYSRGLGLQLCFKLV